MQRLKFLIELVKRDFKERYVGSVLGIWWSFLWPAINIFIYTVIFSKVMGAKIKGIPTTYSYGLYLASGLIPWNAFSNTVVRSSNVFIEMRHIITKVPISLPLLPLTVAIFESITFVIGMGILLCVLFILGIEPSSSVVIVPVAYVVQQVFAYSLGLILATLNVFIRDIREIVNVIMQIWFWFTPIVYVESILPEKVKEIVNLNPAYAFIQVYQKSFVVREQLNFETFIFVSVFSLFLLGLAIFIFKKLEKDVRDFL
ncbi:lipopolysaccharide transport system permease protein [Thermovibrio guaymasensis]|uniref:Transport permease protein n=1 Tax=Thermovibrio guaymasensis TaxID=240167 RepID=A0A420W631_9BACT|nr:lipopolysaccharide transport system permease protein [Thermovibrio guaymasensis]